MELSREDLQIPAENPFELSHVWTYKKTSNCADMAGELYEVKMALLLFLRGVNRTAGFYLASNVDGTGAFDDIVFKYKPVDCPQTFKTCFIQLKHKQRKDISEETEKADTKRLTLQGLSADRGNFSLGKYHESYFQVFTQMKSCTDPADVLLNGGFDSACFVIYTNAPAEEKVANSDKTTKYSSPDRKMLSTGGEMEFIFNFCDESVIKYKHDKELSCDFLASKKEFLSRLCFYCGQANEAELDNLIKGEVEHALHTPTNMTDKICKELIFKMTDWWRKSSDVLTETSLLWKEIFISRMRQMVVENTLSNAGLHFSKQEVDSFYKTFNNSATVFLTTSDTVLSSLKVLDMLHEHTGHFMFIKMELELSTEEEVLCLWQSLWCQAMVIECNTHTRWQDLITLITKFREITSKKLLIVIMPTMFLDAHMNLLKNNFGGEYVTYIEDSFSFSHLDPVSQLKIKKKKVIFQGMPVSLADVVQDSSAEISGEVIHKLLSGHRLKFGCKPEDPIPYYIPRRLERFDSLKKDFKLNNYDSEYFVISNIAKEIQEILPHEKNLRRYIPNLSELTSHVVIKDNHSDQDFEGVCAQYSKKSLHWLKFDRSWLVWRNSNKNINLIKQNLDNKRCSIYPATHSGIDDRVVLVTAEPGMGKTTLITYLAKQIQKQEPSLWIIRINLNDTTDLLEEINEDYFSNLDNTIQFLISSYEKLSEEKNNFELDLLNCRLRTLENVAILFDGFDEICPDYPNQVTALFHCLLKTKVKKLWITSRKAMREKLQESLSLISYTLHPFSHVDQHNFLTQYWKSVMNIDVTEQLSKFADLLLELTSKSLNDKEREFTGIPLQTFMLAESFENEMISYISEEKISLPQRINLLELYERFIEKKHQLFFKEKVKYDMSKPASKRDMKKLKQLSLTNHMNASLVLLLSGEQLKQLDSFHHEEARLFLEEIANVDEKRGIIDGIINNKPHFIHRTFAEYFLALWLTQHTGRESTNTFIQNNLFTENYHIVRYFLDCIFAKGHDFHNAVLSSDKETLDSHLSRANCDINMVDGGGRTVLHLAASYAEQDRDQSRVELLLTRGAHVHVEDHLLQWTPMRYADAVRLWCHIDSLLGMGGCRDDLVQTKQNISDGVMLQEAASCGYIRLLAFVFDCGVDVDIVVEPQDQWSLLHVAADAGNIVSIDFLINKGANLESFDIAGKTPLHKAAFKGHLEVVKSLVNAGANVMSMDSEQSTALHWAASYGPLDVVMFLVEHGANVLACTSEYITPIQLAAGNGHLGIIQYLQSQGGNIMCCDQYNTTPLQEAAERGHLGVVKYLVENGADVNVRDTGGVTPIYWAGEHGHLAVVEYLVTKSAKVMPNPADKAQPLHWAARSGQIEVVKFLVQNGSDIDCRDEKGATPLILASEGGYLVVVEYLISSGAIIHSKSNDDKCALHLAARKGFLSVVDFLVTNGADVTARDQRGRTPLHLSAKYGHLLAVQYLVNNGALLDTKCNQNQTPLDLAIDCEQWDTVQWLMARSDEIAKAGNLASNVLPKEAISTETI